VDVRELAPGLWRWSARHPDWTPDQAGPDGWGPDVASFFSDAGGAIVLVDPIVPSEPDERARFWRALDRDVRRRGLPDVVLTCGRHARSSGDVIRRYPGTRLWAPADSRGDLPAGVVATDPFEPGDVLPAGATAIQAVVGEGEVLLWLPAHRALVAGDTLLGGGPAGVRLCPASRLGESDAEAVRAALRTRLRGLAVERILVTHGDPVLDGAEHALEAALADPD
jgi:glyoxylase-like metal-dependent hydrolase (beta-lactamase superfamily II)